LALLVLGVMASVCLVGLRFVPSKLLRAGLLLQAASLASNFVLFALFLHLETGGSGDDTFYSWINAYLPLILTVLNAASLVLISYGFVRWQRAQDTPFTALQVIVSGFVAYLLLNNIVGNFGPTVWFGVGVGSPFIAIVATLFAASVFLLRPACWKRHPVVTLILVLGAVLFVFQAPEGFVLIERLSDSFEHFLRLLYNAFLLSWLFLLLGFLLLIQTERLRKRAQQAAPAPALVGQKP